LNHPAAAPTAKALMLVPVTIGLYENIMSRLTDRWYTAGQFLGDEDAPESLQERPKALLAKLWHQVFPINVKPVRNAKARDITLQQGGYLCPRCDGFILCFESIG